MIYQDGKRNISSRIKNKSPTCEFVFPLTHLYLSLSHRSTSFHFCSAPCFFSRSNPTGWTGLPGCSGSGMSASVYSDSSESVFLPAWQWLCLHLHIFHPFLWPQHPPPTTATLFPHAHPTLLLCTAAMLPLNKWNKEGGREWQTQCHLKP